MGERAAGDSTEQRRAEEVMICNLETKLGLKGRLKSEKLSIDGAVVCLDGYSKDEGILCEAWAHQGPPKSAQKHKVLADAFKLAFVSEALLPDARRILLLSDQKAAKAFQGTSWMAKALTAAKVEIVVVDLPDMIRDEVIKAQKRQYR